MRNTKKASLEVRVATPRDVPGIVALVALALLVR